MKFIHLTNTPFTKFQKPRSLGKDVKPHGVLWVAKEDEWKEFADWTTYEYEQEFDIDMSKVIQLKTYEDIQSFNKLYGEDYLGKTYLVDWNKVRKDGKSGIYIKNAHIKKARRDFIWYSAFDVECVGIWNADAIVSVTALS